MTLHTLIVLSTMLELGKKCYGLELMGETGMTSGALYPILRRLEGAGWLTGKWEDTQPAGRPRRRYYQLTKVGIWEAEEAKARLAAFQPKLRK